MEMKQSRGGGGGGFSVFQSFDCSSEILRKSSVNKGAVRADAGGSIREFWPEHIRKHKTGINPRHNVGRAVRKGDRYTLL